MCQGTQRINIKCGVSLAGKHSLWCQGNSIPVFLLQLLFNTVAIIVEEEQGSKGLNHINESWKWLGPFIYTSEYGFAVNFFLCVLNSNCSSFHLRKQINFIFWILFFYTVRVPGCIIPTLTSTETFLDCLCKHERDSQSITRETIIQLGTHCVKSSSSACSGALHSKCFPRLNSIPSCFIFFPVQHNPFLFLLVSGPCTFIMFAASSLLFVGCIDRFSLSNRKQPPLSELHRT